MVRKIEPETIKKFEETLQKNRYKCLKCKKFTKHKAILDNIDCMIILNQPFDNIGIVECKKCKNKHWIKFKEDKKWYY